MEQWNELAQKIWAVSVYKDLMHRPVMTNLTRLVEALAAQESDAKTLLTAASDTFFALHQSGKNTLGEYILEHLRYDDTPYGDAAARGKADKNLAAAAKADLEIFSTLSAIPAKDWRAAIAKAAPELAAQVKQMPFWTADESISFENMTKEYKENGAGEFARYKAFSFSGHHLTPVAEPDLGEHELIGYEDERKEVQDNTRALLAGKTVNNMLLYGAAGTGKSATVKNLLAVPEFSDLRIIEVDKEQLADIPELIRTLAGRRQKFILFIDDLSFETADMGYSVLKTVLEGSLEKRPANVVIYATSNRRHLMRETFNERGDDEVNIRESIEERTALSERFGIRVLFRGLNQDEYLAMVERLSAQEGIRMAKEELWKRAIQWEREHASRTPRSAQQFVKYLKSL